MKEGISNTTVMNPVIKPMSAAGISPTTIARTKGTPASWA